MLAKCALFLALVAVSQAALAVSHLEPKPENFANEPGCYISELERVIAVGQSAAAADACYQHVCHEKYVGFEHCGVVYAEAPCTIIENKEKSYPECCPRIQCPDN